MSNLENINDKLPAAGPENKPVRRSPRLQEKSEQKGQVDYLPTVSHPDQTEALDVGSPTSVAHNFYIFMNFFNFYTIFSI